MSDQWRAVQTDFGYLGLESYVRTSYFRAMKRFSLLIITLALCAHPLRAQDARTEERLNKLSGQIEDLIAGQEAQRKRISELAKEIEGLREQLIKPSTSYPSHDDLKRLAKTIEEVDRKRLDDNDKITARLKKLADTLAAPPAVAKRSSAQSDKENSNSEKKAPSEKGFEHTVKSGDSVLGIIQAYKEQNIKVTEKEILKANPNLVPEKMKVGQKIWIPAPQQAKAD
jgi:septal ring factor EnvC (AmiA/AmiB activator)